MRDYAKVAPTFWTGRTGRALRGAPEAQIVAMYLMTSPHANMIGVFHCPVIYIAHETGLTLEGASKGLQRLCEAGFCTFEADLELVWVHEMARFQIGESLKPNDNRAAGVRNEYERIPQSHIRRGFHAHYKAAFHLPDEPENDSPLEAPSKPLGSQEQEQEIEQEQEQEKAVGALSGEPSTPPAAQPASQRGTRLPADWMLPKAWGEWALSEQPTWTPEHVRRVADKFRDYWLARPGKDGRKSDWQATWRNWVRNEQPLQGNAKSYRPTLSDKNREAAEAAKRRLFGNSQTDIVDVDP